MKKMVEIRCSQNNLSCIGIENTGNDHDGTPLYAVAISCSNIFCPNSRGEFTETDVRGVPIAVDPTGENDAKLNALSRVLYGCLYSYT